MIIEIGAGIVCITPLVIHMIKTMNWKSKTEKEIGEFKKHNNFTTNETYADHDITLSKALSNFSMKNNAINSSLHSDNVQMKKKTLRKTDEKK